MKFTHKVYFYLRSLLREFVQRKLKMTKSMSTLQNQIETCVRNMQECLMQCAAASGDKMPRLAIWSANRAHLRLLN